MNNQLGQQDDPTLDNDYNSQIFASVGQHGGAGRAGRQRRFRPEKKEKVGVFNFLGGLIFILDYFEFKEVTVFHFLGHS